MQGKKRRRRERLVVRVRTLALLALGMSLPPDVKQALIAVLDAT